MNRRSFISLLAGAAGAAFVPWRLPEPIIVLPTRRPLWTPISDPTPRPEHYLRIVDSMGNQLMTSDGEFLWVSPNGGPMLTLPDRWSMPA